ncbi:MAG: zf-HC2 domain-containing protein, partial [Candidatus Limnocylindrales bacterium]
MTLTCDEVRDLAAAFVLDALEPDEADAVRAHLASCEDPHTEVAELASVVPALLEDVPSVEPPVELKARIMAAAAEDLETRRGAPAPTPALASTAGPVDLPTVPTSLPTAAERQARALGSTAPLTSWV